MKEYRNIVPTKKFGVMLFSYGEHGNEFNIVTYTHEGEELYKKYPLTSRTPIAVCLLVWHYLLDTDTPLLDVLCDDCEWEKDTIERLVRKDIESDRPKHNKAMRNTLELVRTKWPHDYATATKLIPNREGI